MLTSLNINNVVLIEHLIIEFKHGLCVLTGETGAGKSILLDSLGLALGVRAETGLVRKSANSASVTASFQIENNHAAFDILKAADICIDDDHLLLRRVVYSTGKSRAFINDQPVSIGLLKQVGDSLVEIHGQFETQGLLNPASHRAMLDEYAGVDKSLGAFWNAWKNEGLALDELLKMSARSRQDEEYLKNSLDDLNKLSPQAGEEGELSTLRERLKHREGAMLHLNAANMILSADHDPVQKAWAELDKISDKIGGDLEKAISALSRAALEVSEASSLIQGISVELQHGDSNLEEIDDRLYELRLQARKHGCAVDDLSMVHEKIEQQLNMIENADEALAEQKNRVEYARSTYIKKAQGVSKVRKVAADRLDKLVQKELAPLKLEKARFITDIAALDEVEWGAHGIDRAQFLISTNPGAPAGAINKIASGGELSRFILALKVVIAGSGSTHSFIFDEVDAGLGGATADAVGERLARLAASKQVLVVTHAPQVAARASNHWIVRKSGNKDVTTEIIPLITRLERCEEIARMLAGADITTEARAAADKLLESAS